MRKSAEQEPSQELPDMDRALAAFLAYLQNERNASQHTIDSYRLDIRQFAEMLLETDTDCAQADWNGVDITKFFEKYSFTFHNGHSGVSTDISKT